MAIEYSRLSLPLRICELTFGAIVAGFAAHFLYGIDAYGPIDNTRLVYAETLASVFVLIQIFFVTWGYKYPGCFRVDFPMSVAWIVAFALLVNQISPVHCGALLQLEYQSYGFYNCDQWKVMVTFAFASGMAALASGILGFCFLRKDIGQHH